MIVTNRHRNIALVIRRTGKHVTLVPMSASSLSAEHLSEAGFQEEWREMPGYPLARALERFMAHLEQHGATREAQEGLERLAERDRKQLSLDIA